MIDYEEDTKVEPQNILKTVTDKIDELLELRLSLDKAEAEAKGIAKRIKQLEEQEIPDLIEGAGLKALTLTTGEVVSIRDFVTASITEINKEPAHTWLRANGYGDLIKREFKVPFGKNESNRADSFKQDLLNFGVSFAEKEGVHSQTLSAFVREQLAEGRDLPMELLGVYRGRKAHITRKGR